MIKLNLGCCDLPLEGYINIDESDSPHIKADLKADALNLSSHFEPNTVDEIFTAHLLEHLTPTQAEEAIVHWKSLLKPGGVLAIVTPDFHYLAKSYLEGGIPLDEMTNLYVFSYVQESLHRSLWDQANLFQLLMRHGFKDLKPINRYTDPRLAYPAEWQCGAQGTKWYSSRQKPGLVITANS